MKFSELLIDELKKVAARYKAPDITRREVLIDNLIFCYHTMKASEHLLEIAKEKAEGKLKEFYTAHLEEERQHEKWIARDLESAGVEPVSLSIPRLVVPMVGSQYYFVHHVDPAVLLGYMARLECFPQSLEMIEALEELHGKELLRCARYHAVNDVDHGSDLLNIIDEPPRHSQMLILENAIETGHYLGVAQQSYGS